MIGHVLNFDMPPTPHLPLGIERRVFIDLIFLSVIGIHKTRTNYMLSSVVSYSYYFDENTIPT